MAAEYFVELGNTLGAFFPYKCPHCKTVRKISEYGGNLFEGAICPNCNNDPRPKKVVDYFEEHHHEYEGELTDEQRTKLNDMFYKFAKGNGQLPSIDEILAKASAENPTK